MPSSAFDLQTCARKNILSLEPYRCARDDYKDDGTNTLLDANENSYGPSISLDAAGHLNGVEGTHHTDDGLPTSSTSSSLQAADELDLKGLNRYPDPHQEDLKQLVCNLRDGPDEGGAEAAPRLSPANLFVGVGSDEAIDGLIRCFCVPGKDKILICPPTYGMYTVSACVNDVGVVRVPLDATRGFSLDVDAVSRALSEDAAAFAADPSVGRVKLVFVCSPGNPTGKMIARADVEALLAHDTFNGVVVVDEAYIDFSPPGSSLAPAVTAHPNLVVMQTLSKAFGLAGIRLGVAFCAPPIARLMNSLKAPYNVSSPTSQIACRALAGPGLEVMRRHRSLIFQQRDRMLESLPAIPGIGRFRGGLDSNFLLVEVLDAPGGRPDNATAVRAYEMLAAELGVVCRFRGREYGCEGCLRITVGTEVEVQRLLVAMREALQTIYSRASDDQGANTKEKQQMENDVVA